MKKIIITSILLLAVVLVSAQGYKQAKESNYLFVKKIQPTANGVSFVIDQEPEKVEQILMDKFKVDKKNKPKSLKDGIFVLEDVVVPDISPERFNYYYQIEQPSKKVDDQTRVTLFIASTDMKFVTSSSHPEVITAARRMLETMDASNRIHVLKADIEIQQKAVDTSIRQQTDLEQQEKDLKAQTGTLSKKMEELAAELAKTEQQLKDNQISIENNKEGQKAQEKQTENLRSVLQRMWGEVKVIENQ